MHLSLSCPPTQVRNQVRICMLAILSCKFVLRIGAFVQLKDNVVKYCNYLTEYGICDSYALALSAFKCQECWTVYTWIIKIFYLVSHEFFHFRMLKAFVFDKLSPQFIRYHLCTYEALLTLWKKNLQWGFVIVKEDGKIDWTITEFTANFCLAIDIKKANYLYHNIIY